MDDIPEEEMLEQEEKNKDQASEADVDADLQALNEEKLRKLYSLSLTKIREHAEKYGDINYRPAPFNLRWIHGFNPKVNIINLNENGSTIVFYAASNCGVIFNWTTNQMKILQGHSNKVTSIAADETGKWLVTADSGTDDLLIIWDSKEFFPHRTIFNPHGENKTAKIALSPDAKYLITMGYTDTTEVFWWIWSFGLEVPHAKLVIDIPKNDVQAAAFNPINSLEFALISATDLYFGEARKIFIMERGIVRETNDYELRIMKVEKFLTSDCGRLTCLAFVKDTAQILVGTSRGAVLVFGYYMTYTTNITEPHNIEDFKYLKILKLEKNKITVIKPVDGMIVTGSIKGRISFYDTQMKLLYWVHGFQVESVKDISFNLSPRSFKIFDPICKKKCFCWEKVVLEKDPVTGEMKQKLLKMALPSDATREGKTFLIRDFILSTQNTGVYFVDFVKEKLHRIMNTMTSAITTLSLHPEKPFVCLGHHEGVVEMWNFIEHTLFLRLNLRDFYKLVIPPKDDSIRGITEIVVPELVVTCLKFSPSGAHLACGLNTGQLLFLDPATVDIITKTPLKDTKFSIKELCFSSDSQRLAYADRARTVAVYKYNCENSTWVFFAKHRAHYKEIASVLFLPEKNDDGEYKLISVGTDRMMVEYDIGKSKNEGLEILSLDRIDQSAIPLTAIYWPTPTNLNPAIHRSFLPTILTANDEFKYKIINYSTSLTMATVLGPRFEFPVSKMELINVKHGEENMQYLLFASKFVVGLQKMPLDGNPWKHVGMLAHPEQVTGMQFRPDVNMLFTIGSKDNCMCQWEANYQSVETTSQLGGEDLDPYYCLIENGRPGWLFQEIRDLFYYIQILCQGTFSPAMRRVKDFIPIESLPDMMRALGFFPSEYEVECLIVEAKYKVYQLQPSTEIDFQEFVKLYLNHRRVFGENYKKMHDAFKHFAIHARDQTISIRKNDMIELLQEYGENFSKELAWYLLSILYGHSFEDRARMTPGEFTFLPRAIKFEEFSNTIMGIKEEGQEEQSNVSLVLPRKAESAMSNRYN